MHIRIAHQDMEIPPIQTGQVLNEQNFFWEYTISLF